MGKNKMATIKDYLDYAELAQVSYINGLTAGMFQASYNVSIDGQVKNILLNEFSQTQANNFSNRYKVLATSQQYDIGNYSSFEAVLFLDTQTGKKVMAIRGSQEVTDYLLDAGLGLGGLIYGQNVSLNNFYDALVADNKLSITDKIDVTGHSLGGYLAQLFTAEHPYAINNAYTYNAPGIGGLNQEIQNLFGLKNPSDYNSKITNIYAQNGSEFVAGLGVMLGEIVPLSIDPDTIGANNHRIGMLTTSLHLYEMLSSIAQTQDVNLLTSIMEHSTNEQVLKVVKGIFNENITGSTVDQSIYLSDMYEGIANGLSDLYPKSPSQIATQAKSDSAVLYALAKLNPFAIEGNLPAYANLNRTDMSAKYIEDRAQYLYYLLDKTNRYDVDPTLSMTWYEDAALGSDYTLKQSFSRSRVLFGGEGYSTLNGGDNGDHLYGMGGDDTLTGNGGDDYIEGGKGYDKYITGDGDTIMDSDQNGVVAFKGFKLTGGVSETGCKPNGDGEYRGDGGVYKLSSGKLTFTKDGTNETLTIEKFVNGALGIILTSKDPGASCPPPIPNPGPNTPKPDFPSPLVLDLNGDGVTSTFISSTSTYFDLDNDGVKQRTGWVQTTDALLALDKNTDGIINNASELFGNHTTLKNGTKASNGFEALKEYDENKDGVIDAKDNIYNTLKLWQDSNSDGVTDTGELHTLTELGVKSINLGYTQTTDYEEQNRIFQTSSFTTTDGTTQSINDVWFATESRDTARDTTVTLKETVAALPDFRGAGRAGNLSTAMNSNTKLETAVTALLTKSATSTYDSLLGDVKNILALWTHTDNISATAARGEQYIMLHNYTNPQSSGNRYRVYAYARDMAILETFWGQNFTMNVDGKTTSDVIGTEMSNYMSNAIETLTDTVLATLLVQQLYGKDAYDVTAGQFDYAGLFSKLTDTLNTGTVNEKTLASNLLATLIHRDGLETLSHLDTALLSDSAFKTLLSANGITYTINADGSISGSYKDTIEGTSGNDTIQAATDGTVYGGDGNDIISGTDGSYTYSSEGNATGNEELHGGAGNDTIIGGAGNDILYGDDGDDILYADGMFVTGLVGYGHDVLIGGKGDDTLYGTWRNSTYTYNYGDGNDTIIDDGNVGLTPDILELRGIRYDDILEKQVGIDMVI